ncbi:hypothetical protein [Streptomyces sp. HUAS TT20]|uniref:hypothetical protein n=1 Tax=Streptomyces sp. HUAS TT20 TaxID=3447509 RepID=UPI0021D94212|nr:hypothetical protein [Streptomyces sp. HUAS 15-9]UXY25122.1 hypothetical protein N8I87_00005 [Streptomyces sp. HUAS 15-9]
MTGYRQRDTASAWTIAAAWILATGTTHLMLLRAHYLTPHRLRALLHLRQRTGLHLSLVCHRAYLPVALQRVLVGVDCHPAEAAALLPAAEPSPAVQASIPHRPLANRWISLPALTTLRALDASPRPCQCTAPTAADMDFFPPVMPPVTEAEVAFRLRHATAHPHLAAELATAAFTAASTTQLDTAHVRDLALDASTITLHDEGLRLGCMTHHVPLWARSLLLAAACLWRIHSDTDGPLFSDPLANTDVPGLTAFAESCKLRPPQPPRPKQRRRRQGAKPRPKPPQKTIWPLCTVHYATPWPTSDQDLMEGCPPPPPHTRRTIAARKKGWLPPDYGPRRLDAPF